MRVGAQRKQTLLVSTECALWHYDNAFLLPTYRMLILKLSSYLDLTIYIHSASLAVLNSVLTRKLKNQIKIYEIFIGEEDRFLYC
jgi:hypothetical protein